MCEFFESIQPFYRQLGHLFITLQQDYRRP